MNIILDIIVLIVILTNVFISIKRGFVKSIIGIVSLIVTIALISAFSDPISTYIYDTTVDKTVQNVVISNLDEQQSRGEEAIENTWNALPKLIKNTAENSGITTDSITKVFEQEKNNEEIAYEFSNNIIRPPLTILISVIVNIVLFIILMFLFRIISKVICKIFKAPLLKQANKLLGSVVGLIKGIIIASLICTLLTYIVTFTDKQFIFISKDTIEQTYIFSLLSNPFGLL